MSCWPVSSCALNSTESSLQRHRAFFNLVNKLAQRAEVAGRLDAAVERHVIRRVVFPLRHDAGDFCAAVARPVVERLDHLLLGQRRVRPAARSSRMLSQWPRMAGLALDQMISVVDLRAQRLDLLPSAPTTSSPAARNPIDRRRAAPAPRRSARSKTAGGFQFSLRASGSVLEIKRELHRRFAANRVQLQVRSRRPPCAISPASPAAPRCRAPCRNSSPCCRRGFRWSWP